MLEIANPEIRSFPFDRHGMIASVCKDLKITERIDALLPVHGKRTVSPGRSVVAMILNGLGFTNRRPYLTPRFFAAAFRTTPGKSNASTLTPEESFQQGKPDLPNPSE